jgi:hypothetical protein
LRSSVQGGDQVYRVHLPGSSGKKETNFSSLENARYLEEPETTVDIYVFDPQGNRAQRSKFVFE